jgi:hypothetical protein
LQKATAALEVWDTVIFHAYKNTDASIKNAKGIFTKYDAKFGVLVAQMTGLEDIDGCVSSRDTEVGDLIIRLHQLVHAYDGSMAQNNKLVEFSWAAMRANDNLAKRLRQLLQSAFGTGLFNCIRQLGHPLRTVFTIVRAIGTPGARRDVEVHFGIPPNPHGKTITHKVAGRKQLPNHDQGHATTHLSTVIPAPPREVHAAADSLGTGQDIGMYMQAVLVLVESVVRSIPVPAGSHAYYFFGFVTCSNTGEEKALREYYRTFLESSQAPDILAEKMIKALRCGTLTGLIQNKGLNSLKTSHPVLYNFLTTKPHERSSVYRLIQFVRDKDNDNAAPVLKRDYGFRWCKQQHHVAFLKSVYEMILAQTEPMRLHDACRFGRLRELAIEVLGSSNSEMDRLLVNDYPYSTSGLDNDQGLERYLEPQFKPSKK